MVNGLDSIYGHDGSDINSAPIQVWCSNPIPPPAAPTINPGPSCLAGSNRVVQLIPSGGDEHQIEGMGLGVFDGTSVPFSGLQDGVGYQFRGRSRNTTGFGDWSAWTTAVYQDVLPPVTTINAQTGVWVNHPITVTLTTSDLGCLQTVASITYTLDGVTQPYTSAFTVSAEGSHNLTVSASDGTNSEAPQTRTLLIDRTPPQTTLELADGNLLTSTTTDTLSGVSVTNIRINGGTEQALSAPLELVSGDYSIDYASTDYAGNIEPWRTLSLRVISNPVATPIVTTTSESTRDFVLTPDAVGESN